MRDDIDPFLIPTQDSRPHLVFLIGFQFFLEWAWDGAEGEAEEGAAAAVVAACSAALILDAGAEEGADEVRACYVDIGEVGRVCFWGLLES